MNSVATKKTAKSKDLASNKQKYAPKPVVKTAPKSQANAFDLRLRKITAKVLDDLKMPGAVPSKIIYDALAEAYNLDKR